MNADRTVEALKTILDGKTPEEIDAVVRDLKETLDQAAADIKGEMDIDSTAEVSDLKVKITESNPTHSTILDEGTLEMDSNVYEKIEMSKGEMDIDSTAEVSDLQSNLANSFTIGHHALNQAIKNFAVPDCVIPSESDVKIKSCNRETDITSGEKLFKPVTTLDSSFVCAPEGLFGEPKEFIYNRITGSFYNKDGYKHDDLDDLEVTDLNSIKNTVEDMYFTDLNATDPIQPFATRLFEKKLSKIEAEIYSKYNVKNNLKNIKRKQKINNFLEKLHLSRFNLSVEKHKTELNCAIKEIMLKVNHLDDESRLERTQYLLEKRAKAVKESVETGKPVLYANPL